MDLEANSLFFKPVILHTEESDGWGGQEIRILSEMLGMKGRGYDVLLATPDDTSIFRRAREAGIETYAVPMAKGDFFKAVFMLAGIMRDRKVGIVNTHSSRDSWIGAVAGRMAAVKVLRTRHISSKLNKNPLTRLVYGPLCDSIMTTGEFIKEQIVRELKIDPRKIRSIPTGIDIDRFSSGDGARVRDELGIGKNDAVLGTAAAIRSWKGHEYLLEAMPLITKEFPDVKLILAGDGPIMYLIQKRISELGLKKSVFLLGHREDVPAVINAFDISVLASYASEGIPQFVLQSMAAGKPVIGTAVGGIPEVVKDGVNGIIVPPRDSEAIARAVKTLLSDPDKARRMGRAGYEMAARGHTLERMLDDIEELYEKVQG
jgi:glycosyltransferase involved in cell wall biosynthesis